MKKYLIFVIGMMLFFIQTYAQDIEDFQCQFQDEVIDLSPADSYANSANGWYLTPTDTLRVLVIFAQINYDLNPSHDIWSDEWDPNALPDWKDDLYDPYWSNNLQGKITKYYAECSYNEYKVLGDYLSTLITIDESSYGGSDYAGLAAAAQVIIEANTLSGLVTNSGFDIDDFDMWQNCTVAGAEKINLPDNPHSYDHIMVIFRNHYDLGGGKGSTDDGSYTLYGYGSDTRSRFGGSSGIPFNILHHEYDHMLFGGNNFHTGGGRGNTQAYFMNLQSGWSMMGGASSSFLTCNGWDRDRLGYIHPTKTMTISALDENAVNEVNTDLDASTEEGIQYFVLRDFITYGDVIRIKLPNFPGTKYPQWLWIENHQTTANNESEFDQFQYQSEECVEAATPGLYLYVQNKRNVKEGDQTFSGNQEYLRFYNAGGYYDLIHADTTVQNTCLNDGYYYPFIRDTLRNNPFTGSYVQEKTSYDLPPNNQFINDTEGKLNVTENVNDVLQFHYPFLGESNIAFTLNNINHINIGTNPSTCNMLTYTGNSSYHNSADLRSIYLNNLSIEIVDEDDGNLTVKVQFDNEDVADDVRWCGEEIILPPVLSGNDYSLNITENTHIIIDWGENATKRANPYSVNGVPRFNNPTMFKCIEDSYLHIDQNSIVELNDLSTFVLEQGSTLELESDALFQVANSCSLVLLSGSSLIIHDSGEVLVEDGGYLCIEAGAQITLVDEESHIVLNDGWIHGVNPSITITPSPNCEDLCNITIQGDGEIIDESILTYYQDVIIDETVNWTSQQINFMGNLIIENGGILNLQSSELGFSKYSTIFIERGGVLNNDASTISGLLPCSNTMWPGIEVWGTTTASQSTSGAQGKITIENGGTIENAITAVFLSKSNGSGGYTAGYEGGIIQANDAHFINNRIGVRFYPYHNMVSGVEMDNLSYFQLTEFLTDAELADESTPEEFLYLDCVKGITIQGCSFTNSRSEEDAAMRDRGIGIYSYDADFEVSWYPGQAPDSSTFTRLNYGVKAENGTTTKTFSINHSAFVNNMTGIYSKGIDNSTILFNDFDVYFTSIFHGPDDIFGGLYLDNCTGYTVEENNFYNKDPYPFPDEILSIGITVNNSGDDANMIYRNTFDQLHMGILAQNRNRGIDYTTGLKLKCNICTANRGDFAVTADTASANKGISIHQGAYIPNEQTAPAGNLFSHTNYNNPYRDFNNTLSRQGIYYIHHFGTSQDPWFPVYYQNITPVPLVDYDDFDKVCPPNFVIGGGLKSEPIMMDEEELIARMSLMENLRDSTANILSLWIDGGNTPGLNDEVEFSIPEASLEMYDELIAYSPYLSDTVLVTSIGKEDVLVNAMIRDIMVANPHGVKKEALIEALEQRVPPLPEYMMAEIMAGLDSIAQKEQRESEIAWYEQERALAFNKLMKLYLDDPLPALAEDSLTSLILNHGNLNSQYYLAARYLEHGDASHAFSLLAELPNQFLMDPDRQSEHQDYLTIFSMISTIAQQGLPLDSLDNNSRQVLYQMAEHDSRPAIMAQNILQHIDSASYPEVYILPAAGTVLKKYQAENPDFDSGLDQGNNFRVYPNPCHDYFIMEYYFEIIPGQASYSISDPSGRIIEEGLIEGQQNQLIRRTSSYSSGLYTIKLMINGKVEEALKLNVIK